MSFKIVSSAFLLFLLSAISAWGFTLTTLPPENITATSVTAHGELVIDAEDNPAVTRGFCYGTTADPDTSGLHTSENGRFDNGVFTGVIIGLKPNTLYHVRAYAGSDPNAVSYGNDVTFTTGGRNDIGFLKKILGW